MDGMAVNRRYNCFPDGPGYGTNYNTGNRGTEDTGFNNYLPGQNIEQTRKKTNFSRTSKIVKIKKKLYFFLIFNTLPYAGKVQSSVKDCLNMNIHIPGSLESAKNAAQPLPVIMTPFFRLSEMLCSVTWKPSCKATFVQKYLLNKKSFKNKFISFKTPNLLKKVAVILTNL